LLALDESRIDLGVVGVGHDCILGEEMEQERIL
jgi:hypothetical protein